MIANGLLFVSGQIPIDAETGQLVQGGLKDRTNKILENIREIAKSVGSDLQDVVKIKIFLTDIQNFELVNEVYSSYFQEHLPARAVVQVAALPKNVDIEMESVILVHHEN